MSAPRYFLGPEVPRWQPKTVADVQAAADDGTLQERHWIDAKSDIAGTNPAKTELARDLASFANDGGLLLCGVREDRNAGTFAVDPIELAGKPEMVEQIARTRCDPPLFVQCHPITTSDDSFTGILIIDVPPSPLAPHMVDGRYLGRGDKTKYYLSDPEVIRLFSARTARQRTAEELIRAEVDRDPIPDGRREEARCYVVAKPLASPPELLTTHLMTDATTELVHQTVVDSAPGWGQALLGNEPRATGRGWHSADIKARRVISPARRGSTTIDLELSDDGSITLFAAGFTSARNHDDGHVYVVWDRDLVGLVRGIIALAGNVGSRFSYGGQWQFSVGVTNLSGFASIKATMQPFWDLEDVTQYSGAEHHIVGTITSSGELADQPGAVTKRLMYRFVRALGVEDDYAQMFSA